MIGSRAVAADRFGAQAVPFGGQLWCRDRAVEPFAPVVERISDACHRIVNSVVIIFCSIGGIAAAIALVAGRSSSFPGASSPSSPAPGPLPVRTEPVARRTGFVVSGIACVKCRSGRIIGCIWSFSDAIVSVA